MVGNPPCKRKKVEVLVEIRDNQIDEMIGKSLKIGSERFAERQWKTFVHVTDPVVFCDCLKWKYDNTHKKWTTQMLYSLWFLNYVHYLPYTVHLMLRCV